MNAYSRIEWLHKKIATGCYPNSSHTVEKFSISQRQAQRDIEMLKTEFGAPIKYSPQRKGYYYTEDFDLPAQNEKNETDYVDIVSDVEETLKEQNEDMQLRLPYSAKIKVRDKLTVMNLRRFIIGKDSKDVYNFEFYNVDAFLGVLFVSDADIEVIKPDWLREKLVALAKRIVENNPE
jgi:predicted DNA-binding transcriptional regulator YafY